MAALTESGTTTLLTSFGLDASHPAAAVDGLEARIDAWVRALAAETDAVDTASGGPARVRRTLADPVAHGRVAWLACGGPEIWRDQFLAPVPDPAFHAAFRAALPCLAPAPAPLVMPEQSLRPVGTRSWHGVARLLGLARGDREAATR